MNVMQEIQNKFCKKTIPSIKSGDVIKVHQKVKEGNKERIQVFEGIVLKTHAGKTLDATFTVRKISFGVGVEKTFPLHSPTIVKIEKVKSIKTRRSKLYFLRELSEKQIRRRGELKAFEVWEDTSAKDEEEKLKAEKEAEAKAKKEAEKKEQEELEKKFAETRGETKSVTSDEVTSNKEEDNEEATSDDVTSNKEEDSKEEV